MTRDNDSATQPLPRRVLRPKMNIDVDSNTLDVCRVGKPVSGQLDNFGGTSNRSIVGGIVVEHSRRQDKINNGDNTIPLRIDDVRQAKLFELVRTSPKSNEVSDVVLSTKSTENDDDVENQKNKRDSGENENLSNEICDNTDQGDKNTTHHVKDDLNIVKSDFVDSLERDIVRNKQTFSKTAIDKQKDKNILNIHQKSHIVIKRSGKTGVNDEDFGGQKRKRSGAANKGRGGDRDVSKIRNLKLYLGGDVDEEPIIRGSAWPKKKGKKKRSHNVDVHIARCVTLNEQICVKDFAMQMAIKVKDVVKVLSKFGVKVYENSIIDADTAELVAMEYGHTVNRVSDDLALAKLINSGGDIDLNYTNDRGVDSIANTVCKVARSPVVTIMGHVDHGKTSLLDAIRLTDIAMGESGGITQHIGAYNVHLSSGRSITFLDTPGHEAFTAMRQRGASVTDIVVLVVAANEGIKAQTIEAIAHAKAANVPIIVAANKMDMPDANIDALKNDLFRYDLVPEDMGGEVMVVGVSAKSKIGLDKLEDAILLQADMMNLVADPSDRSVGRVVETHINREYGITATVLVQNGTLKLGDIVVIGDGVCRVRTMKDDKGEFIESAGPSTPVVITGLNSQPSAGDEFTVVADERIAKKVVDMKERLRKKLALNDDIADANNDCQLSLDELLLQKKMSSREVPVLIKADVHGSAEAISHSISKIEAGGFRPKVVYLGVGDVNDSDVSLAAITNSMILCFNVGSRVSTKDIQKHKNVSIKNYSIIYELIDDIEREIKKLISPEMKEELLGIADVRRVFNITGSGVVAGCYVSQGIIKRGAKMRIMRNGEKVYEGKLRSLKRAKEDVKEVKFGFECGIACDNDIVNEGDKIECFDMIEVKSR